MNELIEENGVNQVVLSMLNYDKSIGLIRVFENDKELKKRYMKTAAVLIDDCLVTTTWADSIHFIEELRLYDLGNSQNKYFEMKEHNKIKNLRINIIPKTTYITKAEARAIVKLFDQSLQGYSLSQVFESEYEFTPQRIALALNDLRLLNKPKES